MFVDFHSHILPGIDDGSRNIEMTEKMLKMEKNSGITKIVATPHFYLSEQTLDSFLEKRAEAFEKTRPLAERMGVEIKLAAEVLYTGSLLENDLSKLCLEGTNYMMIELPYQRLTGQFINEFRSFAGSIFPDIVLILAHAERYLNFTDEDSIYEIMNTDMVVQLNSGDFKMFSKHTKFMYDLLKHDMAHLLGTDCHNITSRAPNMDIAKKAIEKKISPHCFEHLMKNAHRAFSGKAVL